jgi:hypothetical protein
VRGAADARNAQEDEAKQPVCSGHGVLPFACR